MLKAYDEEQAAKAAVNPKLAAKEPARLVPIVEAFAKCKNLTDDPRAQAISNLITEMMALDQPFSLVEDKRFCQLLRNLEPRFIIPSRRHFAEECLQAKCDEIALLTYILRQRCMAHKFHYGHMDLCC